MLKLIRIFAEETEPVLLSMPLDNTTEITELENLYEQWNDPEYLKAFFENNKSDLQNGYYNNLTVDEAVLQTREEANELFERLSEIETLSISEKREALNVLFMPLSDYDLQIELKRNKAKAKWLRIYAVRVGNESYVITGGTIKLTLRMDEREHTKEQIRKLDQCRDYLKERGIFDEEGLAEFENVHTGNYEIE
ncbi:MAG: hypothetical protein J0L69_15805 [Bacteroidetes bacterium]|nr:hypothetical protein [Bacteroidota bacterium]